MQSIIHNNIPGISAVYIVPQMQYNKIDKFILLYYNKNGNPIYFINNNN